jgi:WD40 repeat protein
MRMPATQAPERSAARTSANQHLRTSAAHREKLQIHSPEAHISIHVFSQRLAAVCFLQDDVTSVLSVGPAILAGSVDGTLRRFDVRMGRLYTDELHHPVSELALTHDGLCVLAACLDSCLKLLDVEAGELLASYRYATLRICNLLVYAWAPFLVWHLAFV